MNQYCDSTYLEQNWFYWLLSSKSPNLEKYRQLNLLWTKVIGRVVDSDGNSIYHNGQTIPDPSCPLKSHCIALASPIFLNSNNGIIKASKLPNDADLELSSNSPLHKFNHPLTQLATVVPNLVRLGYIKEIQTKTSWHNMLDSISKMCFGIATKFKPKTEEDHHELSNEALIQVMHKLSTYKLVYTPGRAPVFNLLTTTIYRIMYSIMNKRKYQREGLSKLLLQAETGTLPKSNRSFRTQSHRFIKSH